MSPALTKLMGEVSAAWWRYVAASVKPHLRPARAGRPFASFTGVIQNMPRYGIDPAPAPAEETDIVSHEIALTYAVPSPADGYTPPGVYAVSPGASLEATLPSNTPVTLAQVNVDAVGLRGEASDPLVFITQDTTPPTKAGQPSVRFLGP